MKNNVKRNNKRNSETSQKWRLALNEVELEFCNSQKEVSSKAALNRYDLCIEKVEEIEWRIQRSMSSNKRTKTKIEDEKLSLTRAWEIKNRIREKIDALVKQR